MEIIGIITDIATLLSVGLAVIQYFKSIKRENQKATLEAYERLQTEVFNEMNMWSRDEIREAVEDNTSDAYKRLGNMLARIEHFCTGINKGIYDFDTFYDIAHGYFDEGGMLFARIMPILEKKLENASEDYFRNIHKVWKRMDKRAGPLRR